MPGNISWLLMEIVSPLCLLHAAASPLSASSSSATLLHSPLLHSRQLLTALSSLPLARTVMLAAFVIHYANRAVVSTVRNWHGRARMAWYVPLLAAGFNVVNGTLMGRFLAGGSASASISRTTTSLGDWGLKDGWPSLGLFVVGMTLWAGGFITNILCDEVLVRLKKEKAAEAAARGGQRSSNPKERYSIPAGGPFRLYDLVSHPSYFAEWIEWTGEAPAPSSTTRLGADLPMSSGFLLATLALAPSPFPFLALSSRTSPTALLTSVIRRNSPSSLLRGVPSVLRPMEQWYLQPPALFLWNEVAAMLPRAMSGHRWYQRTFGRDWPKERKVVIPFVY